MPIPRSAISTSRSKFRWKRRGEVLSRHPGFYATTMSPRSPARSLCFVQSGQSTGAATGVAVSMTTPDRWLGERQGEGGACRRPSLGVQA